jgi:hypothetical protein
MDRHTDLGRKNMYFVMAMVLTTYVLGVVVFSYWSQFLHTEAGPEDQSVILGRATYLSVFFVAMVILLSLMIYEASTLTVSMMWFEQKKEEMFFYRFLSTRKFGQWLFLFFWLGVVLFTIAILSQRARKFGQVILINVLLCAALLGLQYMYHQTTDNRKKTIFLLVSVVIIGVILGLLYE